MEVRYECNNKPLVFGQQNANMLPNVGEIIQLDGNSYIVKEKKWCINSDFPGSSPKTFTIHWLNITLEDIEVM